VKETITGGRVYAEDAHKCPLHYARIPYEDIRERRALPYLLGGRQRPRCTHCDSVEPWARFCSWDYSQFSQCAAPPARLLAFLQKLSPLHASLLQVCPMLQAA
jgi:hypothetical protein